MILPVGEWRRNEAFYRKIDDAALKARHDEAKYMWFQILMSEDNKICAREFQLETLAFWQHIIDLTETIMKERNIS